MGKRVHLPKPLVSAASRSAQRFLQIEAVRKNHHNQRVLSRDTRSTRSNHDIHKLQQCQSVTIDELAPPGSAHELQIKRQKYLGTTRKRQGQIISCVETGVLAGGDAVFVNPA